MECNTDTIVETIMKSIYDLDTALIMRCTHMCNITSSSIVIFAFNY